MATFLFVTLAGEPDGGALWSNHRLTTALAAKHDVVLLTVAPAIAHDGVRVLALDAGDLPRDVISELGGKRSLIREAALIHAVLVKPDELMAQLPRTVDAVVGYGADTAAVWVRELLFPEAVLCRVLTIDPRLFGAATRRGADWGEWQARLIGALLCTSDVVFAPGPLAVRVADELVAENGGPAPAVHELLPTAPLPQAAAISPPPPPPPPPPLRVLLLGRVGDPNKGALDAVAAVDRLRSRGIEATLTLAGVSADAGERRLIEEEVGRTVGPGWRHFVTIEEFTTDKSACAAIVERSNVLVVASYTELYGMSAVEGLLMGRPVVVAPGYGSGFAEHLARLVGAEITAQFVMDDRDSSGTTGLRIGSGARDRAELIADALAGPAVDYDRYLDAAADVARALESCAADPVEAFEAAVGAARHRRRQAGDGCLAFAGERPARAVRRAMTTRSPGARGPAF